MNRSRNLLIHVIGCSIFLILPFLFSPENQNGRIGNLLHSMFFKKDLIHYVLLIVFFYVNYYLLVPKLYLERKYWLYALLIVACFFIIAYLPSIIINDKPLMRPENFPGNPDSYMGEPGMHRKPPRENFLFDRINHNFFLFFAVLLFSLLLRIALRWRQTEKEKLNAELSYLKAQVNPHFLFNTLNSIYSLALEKSDNAPSAVAKLSSMMRYVITDSSKDFVPLDKEILHINSYIDLQRIRFGDSVKIVYQVTGNVAGKKIAPLILIPFIENAFKYGVNAEEDSLITIDILIHEPDKLIMNVINNKVYVQDTAIEKTGTGITNTKSRLELIYPGTHLLDTQEDEKQFAVSLTLIMK